MALPTTRSSSWTSPSTQWHLLPLLPGTAAYVYEVLYIPSIAAYMVGYDIRHCSYSCGVKLRDDSESNVEQHLLLLPSRQHQRQAHHDVHTSTPTTLRIFDRTTWTTDTSHIFPDITSISTYGSQQQYFELWTLSICCDDTVQPPAFLCGSSLQAALHDNKQLHHHDHQD